MARGKKKRARPSIAEPTPEQVAKAEHRRQGMSYRRVPVIDIMLARKQINERQWAALSYYAEQASLADKSPLRDSLDKSPRGSGEFNLPAAILSAILETAKLERDMGALWEIARAVAVDGKSLTQWCIEQYGGRERYDGAGKFVAIVPNNEKHVLAEALLYLKFAASRIMGIDPVPIAKAQRAA